MLMGNEMKNLITFISILVALAAQGSLPILSPENVRKGSAQADALLQEHDVKGLLALLIDTNFAVEQRAARHLAKLGATEALPILEEKDRAYRRFSTVSLGAFRVAITLLEHDTLESRRQAMLTLAKTGFSSIDDLNTWYSDSVRGVERTHGVRSQRRASIARLDKIVANVAECINIGTVFEGRDRARSDAAAEALLQFTNDAVIRELMPIRAYGAQYTVLAYQCQAISATEAITTCIGILEKHETPQKAEAAERLLKEYGVQALPAVRQLLKKREGMVSAPPPFDIHHTIVSRCENIIEAIEADEAIDSVK